jgi:hypothetical protein
MPTPLYTTDVQKIVDRTPKTALLDTDVFVVADEDGTLAPITKPNAKTTLGISDAESAIDDLQTAETEMKGTGWTDENLVDHEIRIGDLETNDTLQDATLGTLKETVLTTKLAVNELERQAQIGNGATLDFSDIGIVPLDARATGRANPTVEGRTATNLVENGDTGWTITNNTTPTIYTFPSLLPAGKYLLMYRVSSTGTTNTLNTPRFQTTGGYVKESSATNYNTTIGEKIWVREFTSLFQISNLQWELSGSDASTVIDWFLLTSLTDTFGAGNEPSEADCAKIFSYFDGTKSIQLPARVVSKSDDETELSTLYIADNEEVRSIQDVQDLLSMVNGEYIYTKKVSTPASVASGVAIDVTNYPTAKTGGKFAVELTSGGTQIGVIGTDSTSGAGVLRFELATPLTINLTTSGTLKAFQNGSVYYEPYYEGSHQTDASSQITLPYEGTIEAVYGYDEDLVEYLLDASEYSLTGTTLTITDALENEVWFVKMSRSEPLAPEMSVNVLNNDQVTLDTVNGKYYKITFTTASGVPTTVATEVV